MARSTSRSTRAAFRNSKSREIGVTDSRGTTVWFKPDATIFETTDFNFDTLSQRLRELAFLNAGLTITITDERTSKSHDVQVRRRHRLLRRVPQQVERGPSRRPIFFKALKDDVALEIAMQWNDGYDERILHLRQQHQHPRGRKPPGRASRARSPAPSTAYADRGAGVEGLEGGAHRGGRPRGVGRGHQREAAQSPVRRADQDQARQLRN